MGVRLIQTNFSAGEIGKLATGRSGTRIYQNGLARARNVVINPQGGIERRGGSVLVDTFEGMARLHAIAIGATRYLVALTDGRLRIRMEEAETWLLDEPAPWDAQSMWYVSFAQAGNFLFLTDQSFRPQVVERTGLEGFTLTPFAFDEINGQQREPFYKHAAPSVTLEITNWRVGEGRTVIASEPAFTEDMLGAWLRIREGFVQITEVLSDTRVRVSVARAVRIGLDPNPIALQNGTRQFVVTIFEHGLVVDDTFTISNVATVGNVNSRWLNGTFPVLEVIDEHHVRTGTNFRVDLEEGDDPPVSTSAEEGGGSAAYLGTTTPTRDWREPLWSDRRGWPQAAALHGGRLWLGGGVDMPTSLAASVSNSFFNFDVGTGEDDDAILAVSAGTGGEIRHLASVSDLLIFSSDEERYIPTSAVAATPSNIMRAGETRHGSGYVSPVHYDSGTLYIDVSGRRVREAVWSDDARSYGGKPLTSISPEMIREPRASAVIEGAGDAGNPLACWANRDGSLAVFASDRTEQAAGWVKWETRGSFISVASVRGATYFCVYRSLNGVPTYTLERQDYEGAVRLDCAITLTAAEPTTVWSAPALAGMAVQVIEAGGRYIGDATVGQDGAFTTPKAVSGVIVGLPFSWEVRPLEPDMQRPDGSARALKLRVSRLSLLLSDSYGVLIDGVPLAGRDVADISSPHARLDGWVERPLLGYPRGTMPLIHGDAPEPITLLALIPEVTA